ncbi:MAG: sulfatase-like hydrolase/transferase [Actinomycetia bacterium]|nr:sulfatase-like hydrolase/transferase [Actinomycetes bacterium]
MSASRPNILFIITDQQRADHVGFMGNDVVRTPNLDSIAARGTTFDNAWVANPVCMPNRCSIMTGRVPSAHGVIFNDRSLDWNANTFVRQLRDAGYRTGLLGKSHLQHGTSRNSVVALDTQPVVRSPHPPGWDQLEDYERYLDAFDDPEDFYGFDHIELAIDHGARVTGHHLAWALEKGGKLDELLVPYTAEAPALDRSEHWWQLYRPTYDPELHSTSFVTERTIAFIDEAVSQDKPWFAYASFPDPHHPMAAPGPWYDRHRAADMELPSTIDDPMEDSLTHLKRVKDFTSDQQRMWVAPFGASNHDLVAEAIAATYGLIEMIDDGVGQILAAIEARGQLDNTIVVFTSDHGDMMGDHGLMLKGFMPYRGTQQVPLVIAPPSGVGQRSASLASSVDFAATILDLCDLDPYDGIQGQSLAPILADPTTTVRSHVLVEDDCPPAMAAGRLTPHKIRTLISPELRFTRTSSGEELLFDIAVDADETTNLANQESALRAGAVELMMEALLAADDLARGAPIASGSANQ